MSETDATATRISSPSRGGARPPAVDAAEHPPLTLAEGGGGLSSPGKNSTRRRRPSVSTATCRRSPARSRRRSSRPRVVVTGTDLEAEGD